jgi:hypothetical protein
VTTSHLPRRALVGAVLAASVIGGGLVAAFADDAPAGACPTWTDPAGDATTGQEPTGTFTDDQMDILSASLANDGANVVATIGDVKMGDTASDFGDEFHINFTIDGKQLRAYADRGGSAGDPLTSPVGFGAGFTSITDGTSGAATAKYDTKANTVTITGTVVELSKALGADATGKVATAIVAETRDYIPRVGGFVYDDAATKGTFTIAADCGGGGASPVIAAPSAAPDPSASPSPSASPEPSGSASPTASPAPGGAPAAAGAPVADCFAAKDPKGDAAVGVISGAPGLPNDPDLDLAGLTLGTAGPNLVAYLKVDKLDVGPASTDGHRFTVNFTFNKHTFALAGSAYANAQNGQLRDGLASTGQFSHVTQLSVDGKSLTDPAGRTAPGFVDSGLKYTFDTKTSTVSASLPLADVEKYGKAPVAGATFTGLYAISAADTDAVSSQADVVPDGSTASAPGKLTYAVGDNHCFAAAASAGPLTNVGVTKAQYGDVAAVAAKLVDAGAPVSGKTLTFALGASKATGVTGADGVAKATLTVNDKAGRRTLKITGAGASTTVPFTVLVEKTTLKVTGGKGTVAAALSDDDKKPVAGQPVTFTAGSRTATVKTDAKGVAKVAGFAPGTTVKVSYPGAGGMYSAAAGSAKA